MSAEKKTSDPGVPAAGAFYNMFASRQADLPPEGEQRSKVSLRQKAEAHFREREELSSEKLDSLSPESLRTILHELRVHQIELEMQNEELRRAQEEIDASRARYFDLYDLAPVGYCTVSEQGLILEANLTAASLLGLVRQALVKQPISRFILKEDQDIYYLCRKRLFETGELQECELRMLKHDGSAFWACLETTAVRDETGAPSCRIVLSNITARMQTEAYRGMDREVLRILNESEDRQDFIQRVLATLKARTGFDAVGIRLQEGDDFPYFVQEGFSEEFLRTENSLVERGADGGLCRDKDGKACLECTCGLVLSGQTDPSNPLFTKGGSCWTNDSAALLHVPPGEDPRHHPRNRCIHHGYASVALVPIRMQSRIVGLIQLNDRRKGCFAPETVDILEGVAWHIGEALLRKQTEASLRASEARFRSYFELPLHGRCVASLEKGWLEVNDRLCEILGYTREEIIGKTWTEMTHPEDLAADAAQFDRILSGEIEQYKLEKRFIRKEGTVIWAEISVGCVRKSDGTVDHFICVMEDITARKKMNQEVSKLEEQYRGILQTAMDGFCMLDMQGRIQSVNTAFCRMTGYSEQELLTMSITDLEAVMTPEEVASNIRKTSAQGGARFESRHRGKDGRLVDLEISVKFRPSDNVLVSFHHDITARKELDEKIREALDRAEAASRAKSEFLGVMSHELRTPLNGVLGFAELLADTPLNDEQKSFAKTISSSGEHLLAIVNDILDFSSIEHGSLAIQSAPLSIGDLVESSDIAIRQAAAGKGIGFRREVAAGVPDQITGDERRIRQVLINLLGNALKFTQAGTVVFRIAPDAEGRFLEFSIEDTGIGISPETLGRLFKPFTQANSTTSRPFGGTGLGLAISKRLAEAMGGTITVASIPGKGSTFTFRLPLEISTASSRPSAPSTHDTDSTLPSGALVLVVDDDQNSAVLMGKMFQSLGSRAEFATDGAKAVHAFAPGKYSAILMDMAMPVMNGVEATMKIRKMEAAGKSRVPIIAFTANVMPGDRERCLAAGMDAFLCKPFKRAELAAVLASVK
jgi:PAS domain S-box-containing protein